MPAGRPDELAKKLPKIYPDPGLPDVVISNQKSPYWVNLGGSCNGRCWYVDILWLFGIFFPFWYVAPRKILPTLSQPIVCQNQY
jgi:hypothetical protein